MNLQTIFVTGLAALVSCTAAFGESRPVEKDLVNGSSVIVNKKIPLSEFKGKHIVFRDGVLSSNYPKIDEFKKGPVRFCELATSNFADKAELKAGDAHKVHETKASKGTSMGSIASIYILDGEISYLRCFNGKSGDTAVTLEDVQSIVGDYFKFTPLSKIDNALKQGVTPQDRSKDSAEVEESTGPKKVSPAKPAKPYSPPPQAPKSNDQQLVE